MTPVAAPAAERTANPFATFNKRATGDASAGAATEDRFLALLVAQMKNQDPLNPLDNAQVTSQLAQISTVNGVEKLNQTLTRLMESNESAQALQGAALVGRDVLADGNALQLAQGRAAGAFDLVAAADEVTLTVTAASGAVVNRVRLTGLEAGIHTFEWDGRTDAGSAAADGAYSFAVEAKRAGAGVAAAPLAVSRVDGVASGPNGLVVRTGAGSLEWSKIKQVM